MSIHRRFTTALLALAVAALATSSASADLVLSFDTVSTYSTTVGNTVTVSVFVSQTTATGVQVNSTNPLQSAGIELTYATGGAATVAGDSAVSMGPAWDYIDPEFSTSGSNTLLDIGLASYNGIGSIGDTSNPLLLARISFTGVSLGALSLSVADLGPGPSFITSKGNVVDPTNTAFGSINVTPNAGAVPEPASLTLMALAALVASPALARRRG